MNPFIRILSCMMLSTHLHLKYELCGQGRQLARIKFIESIRKKYSTNLCSHKLIYTLSVHCAEVEVIFGETRENTNTIMELTQTFLLVLPV